MSIEDDEAIRLYIDWIEEVERLHADVPLCRNAAQTIEHCRKAIRVIEAAKCGVPIPAEFRREAIRMLKEAPKKRDDEGGGTVH